MWKCPPPGVNKYPALQERPGRSQKGAKGRYSVNLKMAKAIYRMHGVLVQVDSDGYIKLCTFLTHLLLHNVGVEIFHRFFFDNSLP